MFIEIFIKFSSFFDKIIDFTMMKENLKYIAMWHGKWHVGNIIKKSSRANPFNEVIRKSVDKPLTNH